MTVIIGPGPSSQLATRHSLFIPIVRTTDPLRDCFGADAPTAFFRLLVGDARQQRRGLRCHPGLVRAARRRAAGLASGDPWGHVDAAGVTPNEYVRAEGVTLPPEYGERGNNVEEIAAGSAAPWAILEALANSSKHRVHLWGEGDFFARQGHCGIAMAEGGRWGWYWVIMIAEIVEAVQSGED